MLTRWDWLQVIPDGAYTNRQCITASWNIVYLQLGAGIIPYLQSTFLFRLLRYIYRKHNIYCIHIDKKASAEIFKSFKHIKRCFDNIILIEDRVDVIYSSIRQIEAEMSCVEAVKNSQVKWKYYINLTGQEFMLRTNLELVLYLRLMNNTNDIESYKVPRNMVHRFKQRAVLLANKGIVSKYHNPPFEKKIEFRKGSAYGMFTREFIIFVLNHSVVKEFVVWLGDTYAPEETIWATINTMPEAPRGGGGDRGQMTYHYWLYRSRAVQWSWDRDIRCHWKFVYWIWQWQRGFTMVARQWYTGCQ